MVHLTKLAVGIRDIDHLRSVQADRLRSDPPLRHRTRSFPRRREEILQGGSLYWVIAGATLVRQRLLDIVEDQWSDGSACTALILDPTLVQVAARPTKPFQGWRYLAADDAPLDLDELPPALGEGDLPPALRTALRSLCLL
ncbi:MAG: DUF1489 domain-containing protein [Rhodospirillales bacterium]|nr:DUF1489 domain-containing protein [Rhodospirillales bacterium]MBN8896911.1 DUF1489 domain-containing protein [Rhodospirillales bacterium]MBN8907348.1 DUF1489 domain-containing protein [Rhodospirillales bacterium]